MHALRTPSFFSFSFSSLFMVINVDNNMLHYLTPKLTSKWDKLSYWDRENYQVLAITFKLIQNLRSPVCTAYILTSGKLSQKLPRTFIIFF